MQTRASSSPGACPARAQHAANNKNVPGKKMRAELMISCCWFRCCVMWCVCVVCCLNVFLFLNVFGARGGCSGQATIEPHTNTEESTHATLVGFCVFVECVCVCLVERVWCCEAAASVQNKRSRETRGDNPPSTRYDKSPCRTSSSRTRFKQAPRPTYFRQTPLN